MAADVRLGPAESATQDAHDPLIYDVVIPLEQIPMGDPDRWLRALAQGFGQQSGVAFSVERLGPASIKIHVRAYEEQFDQHLGVLHQLVNLANQEYGGDPEADEQRRRQQAEAAAASKAEGERRVLDHVNELL